MRRVRRKTKIEKSNNGDVMPLAVAPAPCVDVSNPSTPSVSDRAVPNPPIENEERLLEKYKLLQGEVQSFRTMLHNSTNFVFVLVGGLVVFLANAEANSRHAVLLIAALGFLLLHFLHVVESEHYLANIQLMRKIECVIAERHGGEEYWRLSREPWLILQMRGVSRHGLHLIPAIACLTWWMSSAVDRGGAPLWQWLLFSIAALMMVMSLAGWRLLKARH